MINSTSLNKREDLNSNSLLSFDNTLDHVLSKLFLSTDPKFCLSTSLAQAEQAFFTSLENMRGLMQAESSKIKRQHIHKLKTQQAKNSTTYNIGGIEGDLLANKEGIDSVVVIKDNLKLDRLAQATLNTLTQYIACCIRDYLIQNKLDTFILASNCNQSSNYFNNSHYINVGFSGGADSALALVVAKGLAQFDKFWESVLQDLKSNNTQNQSHSLNETKVKVRAIHCIHGLDPDDDIWLKHNTNLCQQLNIELVTPHLNIVYGNGVSPEDASRQERYKALTQYTQKQDILLLGHQADDQVESFLLALKRGAGPLGLSGMPLIVQDERGLVVRPLLFLHKIEVEQILSSLGIPYLFDLSNNYLKFERNFIRLRILPKLRERFYGIDKAILRSQKLCRYEHDIAFRFIKEHSSQYIIEITESPYYALDYAKLDLNDSAFVTLLVRYFLQDVLELNADLSLIDNCCKLMQKAHDVNGLLRCDNYVISTFLDTLFVYKELTKEEECVCKGQHFFNLAETKSQDNSLELFLYSTEEKHSPILFSYALRPVSFNFFHNQVKQKFFITEQCTACCNKHDADIKLDKNIISDNNIASITRASKQSSLDLIEIESKKQKSEMFLRNNTAFVDFADFATFAYFDFVKDEVLSRLIFIKHQDLAQNAFFIDFDYTNSLIIKPRYRQHSRTVKKIFIERKVPSWKRKYLPLIYQVNIETKKASLLALANVAAIKNELLLNKRYSLNQLQDLYKLGSFYEVIIDRKNFN